MAAVQGVAVKKDRTADLSHAPTLLAIPVYMAPEQSIRLAYWRNMNLLSDAHMRHLEESTEATDVDVLDIWQADLKSTRGRGKFFGKFTVGWRHLFVVFILVAVTIAREVYTLVRYNDPLLF